MLSDLRLVEENEQENDSTGACEKDRFTVDREVKTEVPRVSPSLQIGQEFSDGSEA